jgi:integrase
MDTGRRPTEICKITWDCLHHDPDGKYTLVYTDFKDNRADRRLPVTDATAKMIISQQQRVRSRFPDTPVAKLMLFPRATRHRDGTRPITDVLLGATHRKWVNALPPLRLEDGREFDKASVFLYAYRHSLRAATRRRRNPGRRAAGPHGPPVDEHNPAIRAPTAVHA